jgi:HAE1 family hydrophobic/amphiphilic exporter-1
MSLSDLSVKNPVFAVMLSAAMIVFGYLGYRDMGVSQFPEIDFPVVSIIITREAASPDIMDGDVTDVVEDACAGVEGVDYIMSQSLEGTSIVTVYFRLDRNIDVAMNVSGWGVMALAEPFHPRKLGTERGTIRR